MKANFNHLRMVCLSSEYMVWVCFWLSSWTLYVIRKRLWQQFMSGHSISFIDDEKSLIFLDTQEILIAYLTSKIIPVAFWLLDVIVEAQPPRWRSSLKPITLSYLYFQKFIA